MPQTIPEQFFETATKFANRKALRFFDGHAWQSLTFTEIQSQVLTLANFLQTELKIQPGDTIAILANNRPEWVISDLAIQSIGAATVPIHITLSGQLTEFILNDSKSVVLICAIEFLNKINLQNVKGVKALISLGQIEAPENLTSYNWNELIKNKNENKISGSLTENNLASIIYTSGTTNVPKGVALTHKNFLSNAKAVLKMHDVSATDRLLSFLPLSHVLERMAGFYTPLVMRGAEIVFAKSKDTILEDLQYAKPTIIISVPRIFEKAYERIWQKINNESAIKQKLFHWALKQRPKTLSHKIATILVYKKIAQRFGGQIRYTISGGASLDPTIAKFFYKFGILVLDGYGLTETSPVISSNSATNFKFGSVGKVIDSVEVKIDSSKEILVKGPNVTPGYVGQSKNLTADLIDSHGWLHTGDLGHLDNENFLTIIGRKKEMITLASGKNVWPQVVEQELQENQFITQAMVVGEGLKFLSAIIVPELPELKRYAEEKNIVFNDLGELIENEKIKNFLGEQVTIAAKNLADWERPKKFILRKDEFSSELDEVTPTLKLKRSKILSRHKKELDQLYQ